MEERKAAQNEDAPMLEVRDEIQVPTVNGICKIQLSYGSVTKLSKDEEVDVLVISAFPGNYVETPWSVIGALRRQLGISVAQLAEDKEEDLRRIFSCWWSKELPENASFRRILCFEGSYKTGARPPTVIGEIFRCLVSLSKKHPIKVMMPLLATGHQGYDYKMILTLLVEAAIHWMEVGLLLQILKIVIYQKDMKQTKDDPMLKVFSALKQKWLKEQAGRKKKAQVQPLHYDIYLSYCPHDKTVAERVINELRKQNKTTVIYSERQEVDPEKTWQDHIYTVMLSCARVITLITPLFLSDKSCLEQYNIALCCTRNMKRDYLAPLYVETIEPMPTYMSLIQYIDCRPLSDSTLSNACSVVANWLRSNLPKLKTVSFHGDETVSQAPALLGDHYDVFISYSHKNSDVAHEIKHHLAVFHPDWKIFIDVADLKTGVVWQTKLYNSIEKSRIVLCLISPAYIASKVCQEEYNLAMALNCDPNYGTVLFPILVEPVEVLPTWCRDYPPLDTSEKNISTFLSNVELLKEFDTLWKPKPMSVPWLTKDWRGKFFAMDFPLLSGVNHDLLEKFRHSKKSTAATGNPPHIVLCYHQKQQRLADFFAKRVSSYVVRTVIERPRDSAEGKSLIDKADMVVLFLSPEFLETPLLVEDANVALCRQRWSDRLILFPVCVSTLPPNPAYFGLFLNLFAISDDIWENRQLSFRNRISWLCTLNSRSAVFLDTAALFASFVVANRDGFKGSFKTLLSLQELAKSMKDMTDQTEEEQQLCNPLVFEEYKPVIASQHSIESTPEVTQEPDGACHGISDASS